MTQQWRRLLAMISATVLVVWAATIDGASPLTPVKAVTLGLVEGATEFLPVSSTGHLLVVQRMFGLSGSGDDDVAATYAIAIQLGAILAVVGVCRQRLVQIARGIGGHDPDGRRLLVVLLVAFAPAGAIGLLLGDAITERLFDVWPIIAAWVVGGVFLISWHARPGPAPLNALTVRHAAVIGCAQLLAFWPGTSRSLATIAATLAVGATMAAAVEFSFLLGLMTLGAATLLDLGRNGAELITVYGWQTPLLGAVTAFLSAGFAARWLMDYLRSRSLHLFGWYRITAAAVTATLLAIGVL